jgi:hypothetical protein
LNIESQAKRRVDKVQHTHEQQEAVNHLKMVSVLMQDVTAQHASNSACEHAGTAVKATRASLAGPVGEAIFSMQH